MIEAVSSIKEMFDEKQMYSIFEDFCKKILHISSNYSIEYTDEKSKTKTYAHYDPNNNSIVVYCGNRSLGDIFRSLAHELVHVKQNELGMLDNNSGKTGSEIENKANSAAGIIMRKFGKKYPNIYL